LRNPEVDSDTLSSVDRRNTIKKMAALGVVGVSLLTWNSTTTNLFSRALSEAFTQSANPQSAAYYPLYPTGMNGKGYGCNVNDTLNGAIKTYSDAIGMKMVRARGVVGDTYVSQVYPENEYYTTLVLDWVGVQKYSGKTAWTLSDWDNYVTKMFSTRPYVHSWEIFNEPQVPGNRASGSYIAADGTTNGIAKAYYNMCKNAWNINHSMRPKANDQIIALGGAYLYEDWAIKNYYNEGIFSDSPMGMWVQALWNGGGIGPNALAPYCNAISVHGYSNKVNILSAYPVQENGCCPGTQCKYTVGEIWRNMLAFYNSWTKKQIIVTETGLPMSGLTGDNLTNQALFVTEAMNLYSSLSYVDIIYWYNLVGLGYQNSILFDFGLFNSNSPYFRPAATNFSVFSIVSDATVGVLPIIASPRENVKVSLGGWPSDDVVTVTDVGPAGWTNASIRISCGSSGSGSSSYTVPNRAGAGTHKITATDSLGKKATTTLTII
jgi:hypothetical protein